MAETFLFHDYETFGVNPALDRPSQFAAIRTDLNLEPIGEPINIFCQQSPDYVPNPEACLITGILPQMANQRGVSELEFIRKINAEFSQAGTCSLGYNSIRFDDEVTRNTLFRNFMDPYAREWQNGNSRWDLIDLARACYALRPEGIQWPESEDGLPSFRLELLTAANGIGHTNAHDALSDVQATIDFAKLLKLKQPKLFDYAYQLRRKQNVAELLSLSDLNPVVHVSGMFGAQQGCVSWVLPILKHPTNPNTVICIDLNQDAQVLLDLDIEQLATRLYTRRSELAPDQSPVPIKSIHINKSPFVAKAAALSPERAQSFGIDRSLCRQNLNLIQSQQQLIRSKIEQLFSIEREFEQGRDPEASLYDGFVSGPDKALMESLQFADPLTINAQQFAFKDQRLQRLLPRYKARNFPHLLDEHEALKWQAYCHDRIEQPKLEAIARLQALYQQHQHDESKLKQLQIFANYLDQLG
ncbi:exodeoxyribonuclease I [Alginatibacterium sediminis]|uniref:Exodeoxyribonuclease I n=1 Tax=Alginatibacterium sediminis TaxID=2164068 RepID=A0A420EIF5_9ALTE|nr:exodeoxyribonuclease I [Alginatibacterium sediminis]RKF20437.1 exodeoxyribonuclease I [Alginatibacterium sediminis]